MDSSEVVALPLPDRGARRRIREELDANLLVEAGAGSGKTTELVNRIVHLLATGTAVVEEVAVVTFTRKAAGELRERLQTELDVRRTWALGEGDDEVAVRLGGAVDGLDRAFVGTIHAFCARLLRERPLEVGLDPAFQEIPAEEQVPYRRRFWDAYVERIVRDADPLLEELSSAGLQAAHLFGLFEKVVENPDVHFPTDEDQRPREPEVAQIRAELGRLVERGMELMPAREPDPKWDSLQRKIRTLAFSREVTGWKGVSDFFEALEVLSKLGDRGHRITQKRWRDRALAKEFCAEVDAFCVGPEAPANTLLHRWYAHRYALGLRLATRAAREFAEHRRRAGKVDFQDLLLLTARLLRERPRVRRELGERYRRLLVDEFQDTDPLQAELMMLLASPPDEDDDEAGDWRRAEPRPGALFVVGDPKQSIYRFRRADIQLYEFVKRRFSEVGDVVELTANFRSRPPVGDLVNQLFAASGFFGSEATEEQARFEPLNTRPAPDDLPTEGVFHYSVHPDGYRRQKVCREDAARLASWIRRRTSEGDRTPGDFMILTRTKHYLDEYARALEARGIRVQVTGAGIGITEELQELVAVLECMVDPANPVKVVAVLVGLFFGLDLERLTEHRLAGGELDAMRPGNSGEAEVLQGLATLHRWFLSASRRPADVFLGELVSELGLLPYAAAGELGSIRAGALLFVLDSVRAAALAGDASLPGALDALNNALEMSEAEAPLQPGRSDVVRLMNLHQAKGLEAEVVVLADPSGGGAPPPDLHVDRDGDGRARGWLRVTEARRGFSPDRLLARPADWEEKAALEDRFSAAEDVRLLYVAVTRAREELVVARWPDKPGKSVWAALDPWLVEHAEELDLPVEEAEDRPPLEVTPAALAETRDEARARRTALGRPSYRYISVTDLAKGNAPEGEEAIPVAGDVDIPSSLPAEEAFRGYSWGSVVHDSLAVAADGAAEPMLRAACRGFLVEYGRPLDDHGEPVELQELLELVHAVQESELWRRARAAEHVLAEVPFAAPGLRRPSGSPPASPGRGEDPGQDATRRRRQLDLFGAGDGSEQEPVADDVPSAEEVEGERAVLEGVIDLVFREEEGWVVADYKTDVGTDPDFARRVVRYRRQVELYAEAWGRLTGEPVKERVLYFTAQARVESW